MDAPTGAFYATNAAACATRYDCACVASLHAVLQMLASSSSRVLEIGGGSGRDAAFMVELGCDTTYTDGCSEMVGHAKRLHPELARNARVAQFPLSRGDELLNERFHLVLCIAVIMHLEDVCLKNLASQLGTLMLPGGRLVLSHSSGQQASPDNRDAIGRLYRERPATAVAKVFEAFRFEMTQQTVDADGMGRNGVSWITQVFQKTI